MAAVPASPPAANSDLAALAARSSAAPAAGQNPDKSCGCPKRKVEGLVLKYLGITHLPGHSWFEMSGGRSVGWYPRSDAWATGKFFRTRGSVNSGQARDPHHGEKGDTESDAYTRDGDCRTDEEIRQCIINYFYNKQASGDVYNIVGGRYCHTIAREAARHCKVTMKAR